MLCPKCQSSSLSIIPAEIRLYPQLPPHTEPSAHDAFARRPRFASNCGWSLSSRFRAPGSLPDGCGR